MVTMSFLLVIVLSVLSLLGVMLLAVLLLPVNYTVKAGNYGQIQFNFKINWSYILQCVYNNQNKQLIIKVLFFNLHLPSAPSGLSAKSPDNTPAPTKKSTQPYKYNKTDPKNTGGGKQILTFIQALADAKFLVATYQLISDLFKLSKPRKIKLKAEIGFSDPYYTGLLMSLLNFNSLFRSPSINIQPVWREEIYLFDLFLTGRIVIIRLLVRLIKYLLNPAVRKNIRQFRKISVAPETVYDSRLRKSKNVTV